MNWNVDKAKEWLFNTGLDHIRDSLFAEGGELVYESKWGDAFESEKKFRSLISKVLWWEKDDINQAVKLITLRITAPNPSETEAYKEGAKIGRHNGYFSFDKSKAWPVENPYPNDVEDYLLWNKGYSEAYFSADSDGMDGD